MILRTAAAALLLAAGPALAANVGQPYQNVDHSNDAGNNTGDNRVDTLNRGQLDENQRPTGQAGASQAPAQPAPPR